MSFVNLKKIIFPLLFAIILILLSLLNKTFLKSHFNHNDNIYKNEVSINVQNNNIKDINYDELKADIDSIDAILLEQILLASDKQKKVTCYDVAQNVYSHKINEIVRVLNDKLDDEDFKRLYEELDQFNRDVEFATKEIENTIDSPLESKFYINKYLYEEKLNKCHEILDRYKGFLTNGG